MATSEIQVGKMLFTGDNRLNVHDIKFLHINKLPNNDLAIKYKYKDANNNMVYEGLWRKRYNDELIFDYDGRYNDRYHNRDIELREAGSDEDFGGGRKYSKHKRSQYKRTKRKSKKTNKHSSIKRTHHKRMRGGSNDIEGLMAKFQDPLPNEDGYIEYDDDIIYLYLKGYKLNGSKFDKAYYEQLYDELRPKMCKYGSADYDSNECRKKRAFYDALVKLKKEDNI